MPVSPFLFPGLFLEVLLAKYFDVKTLIIHFEKDLVLSGVTLPMCLILKWAFKLKSQ